MQGGGASESAAVDTSDKTRQWMLEKYEGEQAQG